jgi:hypothetical protein
LLAEANQQKGRESNPAAQLELRWWLLNQPLLQATLAM